ncbi:Hypothetical predicted protein [Lecanosticta acicola]|uniref:Uncharacterized protein n=1 Tax=Lecanosticta acicola TaxID=111012 RepID=A0AAI9EFD5_9PEZI|nr:Hypothetical predicted protein [Lecanosticta acicola]
MQQEQGLFMGTVAANSPHTPHTFPTLDELVAAISPRIHGQPSRANSWPSMLLLLLTPRYAQQALSPELATSVLQRFPPNSNPTRSKPLDAITAVVDRLPIPGGPLEGVEGLAYAFVTNPSPLYSSSQLPLRPDAQKPGFLAFENPWAADIIDSTNIQVPLAHTIFANGLPSTLLHTRFQFDPLTGLLQKSASQRLESQTVRMSSSIVNGFPHVQHQLEPLTPFRKVRACMGNIIRSLSPNEWGVDQAKSSVDESMQDTTATPESTGTRVATPADSLPASQELEAAVSNYFQYNNLAPEPVQVWALIIPNERHVRRIRPGTLSMTHPKRHLLVFPRWNREFRPLIDTAIWQFLKDGARLHRVLSGGGGWGKKAGLLSLDPDIKYDTRQLRDEKDWHFNFDVEDPAFAIQQHQKEALGDIIRPGEGVMFLLAKRGLTETRLPDLLPKCFDGALVFGTIPSSVDELPQGSLKQESRNEVDRLQPKHFRNYFGALSETGLALQSLAESKTLTQTKLDIPWSLLVLPTGNLGRTEDAGPRTTERPIKGSNFFRLRGKKEFYVRPSAFTTPGHRQSRMTKPIASLDLETAWETEKKGH